jgi:transmembrane sensor
MDRTTERAWWLSVQERRERRSRLRKRAALATAFATSLAVVALVASFGARHFAPPTPVVQESAGALRIEGSDWGESKNADGEPRSVELTDGSRIVLDPGARVQPLENTGRSVVVLLRHGRAVFDVKPGGPRKWSIEAGLATVEVVGTRFAVTRAPDRVTVEVEHGVVLVRGDRVANRVQRLVAGERLEIPAQEVRALPSAAPAEVVERPAAPSAPPSASPSATPSKPLHADDSDHRADAVDWHDLAHRGDYAGAYAQLGAKGLADRARTADVEQVLALADVARFSGHPADAVAPLRRVMSEYAHDPRAALAAFTLGRLELHQLGDPAAAAQAFERSIALHLSDALLEDAYIRLIEARAKSGDRHAAHEAWAAYHERFPNSTRRLDADQWRR